MLQLLGSSGNPVLGRVLASLLFPLLTVALQLVVIAVVRTWQQARRSRGYSAGNLLPGASFADAAVLSCIVTFSVQQFAVSRAFLEAAVCVDVNGTSYLAQDTDIVCWSSQHHAILWLAVPGFVAYAILFPAVLLYKLVANSDRLQE